MSKDVETILDEDAFLVSQTDEKGTVIFANEQFCKIAEYSHEELLNQNHNIVRHPDMPNAAFKDLWDTVKSGKAWQGFVKNKTKSNGFYWVFATVYPYKDETGRQCYISCRRKPSRENVEKYSTIYKSMQ